MIESSSRRRLGGILRCEQDAGVTPEPSLHFGIFYVSGVSSTQTRVVDFAPFHPSEGLSTVIFPTS
jgi:hypothetical protein